MAKICTNGQFIEVSAQLVQDQNMAEEIERAAQRLTMREELERAAKAKTHAQRLWEKGEHEAALCHGIDADGRKWDKPSLPNRVLTSADSKRVRRRKRRPQIWVQEEGEPWRKAEF